MQIIIDIETIPSQQTGARELVRDSIKPPGTLKKAESIAAWWASESDGAVEDAYRKQSLDGGLAGEIISIAIASTDDDVGWVYCREQGEPESVLLEFFIEAVEARLLRTASHEIDGYQFTEEPHFIAHNAAFDMGFIWRRCIVNSVRLPFKFPTPNSRGGKDFGCTMLAWAGHGNRVSLDALCRTLKVVSPKDGGISGAGVYDAWLAGEYHRIAAYNLRDTLATREVWHRLNGGRS
jgi:hypothetical protein